MILSLHSHAQCPLVIYKEERARKNEGNKMQERMFVEDTMKELQKQRGRISEDMKEKKKRS